MIAAESLSFSYSDGIEALARVNLKVKAGEFVALMGANGSGKTTLLKLLIGLLKPSAGRVFLDGKELRSYREGEVFRRVGMVFQDPNDQLFATRVVDDVGFGVVNQGTNAEGTSLRVAEALATVGCSDLVGRAIHSLSFGQKRRVALAGVLAMQPSTILLDEPTGGLDSHAVNPLMRLLKRLQHEMGTTLIMATHDVELVPLFCDRVLVLEKGRIVAEGAPRQILGNPALARQVSLRLPRVTHLAEILQKEDGFRFDSLPLTIGEARRELLRLCGNENGIAARTARAGWGGQP